MHTPDKRSKTEQLMHLYMTAAQRGVTQELSDSIDRQLMYRVPFRDGEYERVDYIVALRLMASEYRPFDWEVPPIADWDRVKLDVEKNARRIFRERKKSSVQVVFTKAKPGSPEEAAQAADIQLAGQAIIEHAMRQAKHPLDFPHYRIATPEEQATYEKQALEQEERLRSGQMLNDWMADQYEAFGYVPAVVYTEGPITQTGEGDSATYSIEGRYTLEPEDPEQPRERFGIPVDEVYKYYKDAGAPVIQQNCTDDAPNDCSA